MVTAERRRGSRPISYGPSMTVPTLRTKRLVLRPWRPIDREPFAELNADPEVMRHLPGTLERAASDAFADRIEAGFAEHDFGQWAVEVPGTADFIGFVGLSVAAFEAHFTPAVEVGWRLASEHWGRGYATEAATAALDYAFGPLAVCEVVSFTVPANAPSRRVMERLGMTHDAADDFDHPRLAADSPLRRHVLYRIDADDWRAR